MLSHEYFQFNTEFVETVYRNGTEDLKIAPQFEVYLQSYSRVDEALVKITKSPLTAKIRDANTNRDTLFRGLVSKQRASERHPRAEVQQAAARLKIVFDTYGNIAKLAMNKKTSAIHSLMQELRGRFSRR